MIVSNSVNQEIGFSAETCGFHSNYHDIGTGDPVLLIHGSGPGVSSWANWRLVIPELAKCHRVIALDMAGFGYTQSPPDETYGLDLWVGQVIALLDTLGIRQTAVVGNSFGGAVALAVAARHPDRVAKLVLMGSVGVSFPLTDGLDKVWGYVPSRAAMAALLPLFVADPALISEDLIDMRYRASIRSDVQQRFAALFPAPRQQRIDALATDEDVLRTMRVPALLIHGQDDEIIPILTSEKLAALIPGARLVRLPGPGTGSRSSGPRRSSQQSSPFWENASARHAAAPRGSAWRLDPP